jgi:hypothetical protein
MTLYDFVIPLGITTISLLVLTVLFGLRTKIIKAKIRLKIHITLAIITLVVALIHSGIVLYYQLI